MDGLAEQSTQKEAPPAVRDATIRCLPQVHTSCGSGGIRVLTMAHPLTHQLDASKATKAERVAALQHAHRAILQAVITCFDRHAASIRRLGAERAAAYLLRWSAELVSQC